MQLLFETFRSDSIRVQKGRQSELSVYNDKLTILPRSIGVVPIAFCGRNATYLRAVHPGQYQFFESRHRRGTLATLSHGHLPGSIGKHVVRHPGGAEYLQRLIDENIASSGRLP